MGRPTRRGLLRGPFLMEGGMSKAELVLDALNKASQYKWSMQYRYENVEYLLLVPVQYGSYGASVSVPLASLGRYTTQTIAKQIFEDVALSFGIHYISVPNDQDRFPIVHRAPAFVSSFLDDWQRTGNSPSPHTP